MVSISIRCREQYHYIIANGIENKDKAGLRAIFVNQRTINVAMKGMDIECRLSPPTVLLPSDLGIFFKLSECCLLLLYLIFIKLSATMLPEGG